jgi:hypothetical protein
MTNTLSLVKALDTSTPRSKRKKLKPRRLRRQEERDRIKSATSNKK